MNATMMTLDDGQLAEIEGGNPLALAGMAVGSYVGLLQKMENNPQEYTFLMDWYYD
jgi:hypothetical protein